MSLHKTTAKFSSNPRISFLRKSTRKDPPWKVTKTKPFLSTCYGDPSATEVPPCCEVATKKCTFSTRSVLLLLNVPLSLSRGTIFRRQKNPRRGYRPKIAGILFVCNEPGRSIPYCALNRWGDSYQMCQKLHHMIHTHDINNFLRAKHVSQNRLTSRWLAKHPPCPSKIFTRLSWQHKEANILWAC